MYTGMVVTLRSFALVLVLLFAATPVLEVVCEIECDRPPATSACHNSAGSRDAPVAREARRACDHNETTGPLAIVTGIAARDSVRTSAEVAVATLLRAPVSARSGATAVMHGPPGLSDHGRSSLRTVLRI
jgi:hypothetical protein